MSTSTTSAGLLSGSLAVLKKNSVTASNLAIALATIAIEKIFSASSFSCPCRQSASEGNNQVYGLVFLVVPAIVLMILGVFLNPDTWKAFTGVCRREKVDFPSVGCYIAVIIFFRALVAPTAWICMAFLDGQYYACAVTAKPHNQTCKEVYTAKKVIFSHDYRTNLSESQIIGWIITSAAFFLALVVFAIFRCSSKMTYWQKQYFEWTKEIEGETFETKAKEKVKQVAETNAGEFFSESRTKKDWDKVATMFRGPKTEATPLRDGATVLTNYSSLQLWVADLKRKKELEKASSSSEPPVGSTGL